MNSIQPSEPPHYWQKPTDWPEFRHDWIDPEPDIRGMLSADRIQYYVDLVRMIDPFVETNLKPASYSLTLGPNYQVGGANLVLTDDDPVLLIPPNSIVFASMGERLRLPHYIAARFNLAIDHVYKGLLLGTGPQVDPGFQGVLSCPLHNISNQAILIPRGEHLATIDFIKTTPFAQEAQETLSMVDTESQLYEQERNLLGKEGKPHKLFAASKKWKRPIIGYRPGPGDLIVESSVAELASDVRGFRKILTRVGIGSVLAALALFLTLVATMMALYTDLKDDITADDKAVAKVRHFVDQVQQEQSTLERQMDRLRDDRRSREKKTFRQ